MADDITASGKYLLISVPEFARDAVGPRAGQPMTSFLRLGAFHEHPENEDATQRALWLAEQALVVSSGQGGPMTGDYGQEVDTSVTGVEGKGVFLDDQRIGDPPTGPEDTEATSIPQSERMAQSAALLTRGGWWEHSDGNRISTTWGDKVEVIRGAYKMVVMSRQDDPGKAGGWDLSGGHIQDLGPNSMPGASVRLEFRTHMFGQRGTWHLENTTNNFIQTSDYAGDFFEHWFGEKKYSTVGSDGEHANETWNDERKKPYGNPHILEKTWARKIESYTGSAAWRIPEIIEETYADKQTSLTDVTGEISETTYSNTKMVSRTGSIVRPVPFIHEETWAAATTTVTNVAGIAVETTNTTTQLNTTLAGAIVDITVAGAMEEVAVHAHHGSLEVAGMANEFFFGIAKTSVTVALGQLDVNVGFAKEIKIPNKEDVAIKKLRTSIKNLEASLDSQVASLSEKHAALEMGLQGLAVQLGL